MKIEVKTCLTCRHCYLNWGEHGYSEMTPSTPMYWDCIEHHWGNKHPEGHDGPGKEDLEKLLMSANGCKDYVAEEYAKED